jgi:HEAT repeat protein
MSEELELALDKLVDDSRPVRAIDLSSLSDLPRAQRDLFRAAWATLDEERRFEVVQALVEQAEANVHLNFSVALRECMLDPDVRVRKAAIDGLWEDCKVNLIAPLVSLLMTDEAVEVRAAAAISLSRFVLMGELGEITESYAHQVFGALQAAWLRPHEDNEVRRRALEGMAYTSEAPVLALIHSAYYDEDPLMRQSAVFAMGRSAERRWSKLVLGEFDSPDAAMRFEAATAAGELGLPAAVRPLIHLLEDADSNVREAAAMALGKIGGAEAQRALEACVAGDDARLAEAAQEALEELTFSRESLDSPLLPVRVRPAGAIAAGDEDDDDFGDEQVAELEDDEDDLFDDDLDFAGFFDDDADSDDDEDSDEDWDDDDDGIDGDGDADDDEDWN